MTKGLISLALVVALVCCFCGTSAYSRTGSDPKEPTVTPTTAAEKTQAQEKLKADVAKLVSDAKAGKLKVPAQQFPQPKRNNLSKGAKIAIGAGIAAAVIFIILWYTNGPGSD
jgi:cell division protein FtsL